MSGEPVTTFVATLLYRETMSDGFLQIVAEFNEAFRNRPQLPYSFDRPYDDFAVFDIDGAHIVVAHGDTAEPGAARGAQDRAVVALAISAAVGKDEALVPRFQRLLRSIVGRIQRPFPAEAVLWSSHDGGFDPDAFDALVGAATRTGATDMGAAAADPRPRAEAAPAAEAAAPETTRAEKAEAVETAARPLHPTTAEPEQGRPKRPRNRFAPVEDVVSGLASPGTPPIAAADAPKPETVANSLPDVPVPMLSEAARIRLALYPEPEVLPPQKAPTVQRVTIYTLNTALILVAMPVGVAVLTYNVLGRESMTTTARSVALAGFGVAFAHTTTIGQALLAFI
ncbi:hypothetical protein [Phaeovulum sp.]|uniref:hypothetical protein n=1 Tax=Phaeovulum sp. TaxID=2934796 RepID=UPI0027320300|nr:hypothetical protein [Phaeovulum sp.]MDP1670264.1 hypothetical protein [Phaeovulum sp.]MDZ4120240.1 hypothetical protein [Phaeovulum sp.]